jgi:hypothetical protein
MTLCFELFPQCGNSLMRFANRLTLLFLERIATLAFLMAHIS